MLKSYVFQISPSLICEKGVCFLSCIYLFLNVMLSTTIFVKITLTYISEPLPTNEL